MSPHDFMQLRSVAMALLLAIVAPPWVAGCSGDAAGANGSSRAEWTNGTVNVVSRPVVGAGVAAATELRGDGRLQTAVFDLDDGARLWARPATMAGRPAGMGVQPPAVAGRSGRPLVVALEPRQGEPRQGAAGAGTGAATLVARDARTGRPYWARPVDSTFGPAGCGPYICVSESTARADAHFVALDPATGRARWRIPGVAEVEWSDAGRVVVFRMARRPVLEARDLRTGAAQWSLAVDRAVGHDVDLSGGWDFGAIGDIMVGRIGPYQEGRGRLSSFGFFGVRLADGRLVWARPRLLRVYPGAAPAVALIARTVDGRNRYGGFEQLDPGTGRPTVRIPAPATPPTQWWVSFPADLSAIGFLSPGHPGTAYDLRRGTAVAARGRRTWSFCTVSPAPLKIAGQRISYYPIAPLCAYDLATGRRAATAGAPPGWYTGAADGWRVWRDERGALHARHDARGTAPGMYG